MPKGISNRAIFSGIVTLAITLLVVFWYSTNIISSRMITYCYTIGIVAIIITLINGLLYRKIATENKTAIGIFLAKYIFDISVLIVFTLLNPDKVFYYCLLSVISSVFVTISVIDNISKAEPKETDFHIPIHDKSSPIPTNFIIPMYLIIFFSYGFMVWMLGNTLIAYPQFTALGNISGAFANSFGVGDFENLAFIIMAFVLTSWVMRKIGIRKGTYNKWAVFFVSLLVAVSVFELYHTLTYGANVIAQVSVAIFATIGVSLYEATKSIMCSLSPLHDSNNFWGTVFSKTVFGMSVSGGIVGSIISIFIPIIIFILAIFLAWRFSRRKR